MIQVKSKYKFNKLQPSDSKGRGHVFAKYTQSNQIDDVNSNDQDISIEDQYDPSHLYTSGRKLPSKKMLAIQENYERTHPFAPKIDENSKLIVESKVARELEYNHSQDIHIRLYNLFFQKADKSEKLEFKPQINKNSDEIIKLMREGNDYDKQDRWKSLYAYGVEKQIMRKTIDEQIKKIREDEIIEAFPYKPQILPYPEEKSEDVLRDVVDRTKEWASVLEMK